jgi:hypothetical protein
MAVNVKFVLTTDSYIEENHGYGLEREMEDKKRQKQRPQRLPPELMQYWGKIDLFLV